jgi:hypothetical protein
MHALMHDITVLPTSQNFRLLIKLWRTMDALMHDITVSPLEHIGPSNILNLAVNIPSMLSIFFQV